MIRNAHLLDTDHIPMINLQRTTLRRLSQFTPPVLRFLPKTMAASAQCSVKSWVVVTLIS